MSLLRYFKMLIKKMLMVTNKAVILNGELLLSTQNVSTVKGESSSGRR